MNSIHELRPHLGISQACRVLAVPRSRMYTRLRAKLAVTASLQSPDAQAPHIKEWRNLNKSERDTVLNTLNSPEFMDCSPRQVFATLLSRGIYLCHWRTMYTILGQHGLLRERRAIAQHPTYHKPVLCATAPNQVWTWDITRLLLKEKWQYLYLYVCLDLYSRYVVGWMIAEAENATLAQVFIQSLYENYNIKPGQLVLHADNGSAMTAKSTSQLLIDLKIAESHSRPRVSNDNPYSESAFKTMKYSDGFPERFEAAGAANMWCHPFFDSYNHAHAHSGIALFTPADVFLGRVDAVLAVRQAALDAAFAAHPRRFASNRPIASRPPASVGINWPTHAIVFKP